MKIVTREVDDVIMIGEDIEVTILEVHEDHVRLGITSPRENPSYWEEIVYCEQADESETMPSELQMQ